MRKRLQTLLRLRGHRQEVLWIGRTYAKLSVALFFHDHYLLYHHEPGLRLCSSSVKRAISSEFSSGRLKQDPA